MPDKNNPGLQRKPRLKMPPGNDFQHESPSQVTKPLSQLGPGSFLPPAMRQVFRGSVRGRGVATPANMHSRFPISIERLPQSLLEKRQPHNVPQTPGSNLPAGISRARQTWFPNLNPNDGTHHQGQSGRQATQFPSLQSQPHWHSQQSRQHNPQHSHQVPHGVQIDDRYYIDQDERSYGQGYVYQIDDRSYMSPYFQQPPELREQFSLYPEQQPPEGSVPQSDNYVQSQPNISDAGTQLKPAQLDVEKLVPRRPVLFPDTRRKMQLEAQEAKKKGIESPIARRVDRPVRKDPADLEHISTSEDKNDEEKKDDDVASEANTCKTNGNPKRKRNAAAKVNSKPPKKHAKSTTIDRSIASMGRIAITKADDLAWKLDFAQEFASVKVSDYVKQPTSAPYPAELGDEIEKLLDSVMRAGDAQSITQLQVDVFLKMVCHDDQLWTQVEQMMDGYERTDE
ncbi:hypothetical protein TruAng_001472 [Truncatella angustata]|nr:hypothetical protein TruAng_001472 [Truncatella angustata]